MHTPKISIITPSFNQGEFIEATILSVINQTYKNIQYILVDGGSTDNTMQIVEKYKEHIDIVISEKDKGQSDAINKGFKLATGDLVGWINSDDILYPDCVNKIVALAAANPDGSIYYSSRIDLINARGELIEERAREIKDKNDLLNRNYDIIQQGSFYKMDALVKVGFLDEKLNFCMDLDLWLKLLDTGNIYYTDEGATAAFRIWEDGKTVAGIQKFYCEVEKTLKVHGMSFGSPNQQRLIWRKLKHKVKLGLGYKGNKKFRIEKEQPILTVNN